MKHIKGSSLELFCLLLTVALCSRLAATYLTPSRTLRLPEWSFATATLGRDLVDFTLTPVYQIRQGIAPYIFGYGSIFPAWLTISAFETIGICNPARPAPCITLGYQIFIIIGIIATAALIFSISNTTNRALAVLFLGAMLVGVPMNKAIEAGNMDLIMAPIMGATILLLKKINEDKRAPVIYPLSLGVLLGLLLSMKAFMAPVVIIGLFVSAATPITFISFVGSYVITALWPRLYGVPAGIFDVFSFAMRSTNAFGPQLYTQVNYGNTAVIAYVSNILQAFDKGRIPLPLHNTLTNVISLAVILVLFVKPIIDEHMWPLVRKHMINVRSFAFILLLFVFAYVVMLTLTPWSYDYRIVYALPLLFFLLEETRDPKTRRFLYISIASLVIKSLWIPKDRIMTIFLYIHYYFLLCTVISHWKYSIIHKADRKTAKGFV